MTPEQQQRARELLERGCGLPAGRDLLVLALRQAAARSAARKAWREQCEADQRAVEIAHGRPERVLGYVFIALIVTVGVWVVACLT